MPDPTHAQYETIIEQAKGQAGHALASTGQDLILLGCVAVAFLAVGALLWYLSRPLDPRNR